MKARLSIVIVALWIDRGSLAHFRNLVVTP